MHQNAVTIPGLENIKRIVVVMFENRSFDHIFGALPGVDGLLQDGKVNTDYYNLPNPLEPPSPSNAPVYPTPINPDFPLQHDFTHDFGDGMMPDLFGPTFTVTGEGPCDRSGTYTSGYVNKAPTGQRQPVPRTHPATHSGFYSTYNTCERQGKAVLSYFDHGVLKVLPKLAEHFVVCENWHCDMPGHTLPNRSFIHCGTTGTPPHVGIDDSDRGTVDATTIFDRINQVFAQNHPLGWKMYAPVTGNSVIGQLDTRFLASTQGCQGFPITDFKKDCEAGTLPFYSFIMCWLPDGYYDAWTDTSMHPNSLVQPGENLLAAVYNTIRANTCWEDTLLVVTFDENGGIYDHVYPPNTTPPDPTAPPATQSTTGSCGNKWTLNSQFDFSLLGFRIPALLISPWLAAGLDRHQYQNTSVTRFLIDRLNAEYGAGLQPLTARDANAPALDTAFRHFGQDDMRKDCPLKIEPYKTLPSTDPYTNSNAIPYSDGDLTAWQAPEAMLNVAPVSYILELLNIYVGGLPGHPDSGKKITRTFATNAEVASYSEERVRAAMQYYQAHSQGTGA